MRPVREILQSGLILADGAIGTYYAQLNPDSQVSYEMANLARPELIRRIHREYLAAGSRLLRSNTFAAAAQTEAADPARLREIVRAGYAIATALDPGVPNPAAELGRVMRKKDQGAALFLTQPVFDPAAMATVRLVRAAGVPVLVGLMPLVSYRNARFLSQEVPGIRIPAAVLERFAPDQPPEEAIAAGIGIACEIAAVCRSEADGFYLITPFGRTDIMIRLIRALRQQNLLELN